MDDLRAAALSLWMRRGLFGLLAVAFLVPGCGDDGSSTDAGEPPTDSGRPDTGADAGPGDAGHDAGPPTVTIDGVVRAEGEDPREPIAGATVSLLWPDGEVHDTATTDADGAYALTGPAETLMLLRVEPVEGYLGVLRGERCRPTDYTAYHHVLSERGPAIEVVEQSGSTWDSSLGSIVVGFNPVSYEQGGEGATLEGVTHDPAFVLYPDGLRVTNVLPPICGAGQDPEVDDCAGDGRNNQVVFPNVSTSMATVRLVQPAGGTCTERFGIEAWPVFAQTTVLVNVDCE